MILTGAKIVKEVNANSITLDPFDITMVNPNSYNYRLGEDLLEIEYSTENVQQLPKQNGFKIPKNGYILQPNKLYLGVTHESIGSSKYVTSLIGRSSLGRLGLFLQITADLGHIGTHHKWTLELKVVQPLIIYPRMRIGQVSFWKPDGLEMLNGHQYKNEVCTYAKYNIPTQSNIRKLYN
jgi:dCTP deaminase